MNDSADLRKQLLDIREQVASHPNEIRCREGGVIEDVLASLRERRPQPARVSSLMGMTVVYDETVPASVIEFRRDGRKLASVVKAPSGDWFHIDMAETYGL